MNRSMMNWESYECPACNWEPPDYNYFIINKQIVDAELFVNLEIRNADGKPIENIKSYPRIQNYQQDRGAPWNYHGHSWVEIHLCPNCNKEFEFANSDY